MTLKPKCLYEDTGNGHIMFVVLKLCLDIVAEFAHNLSLLTLTWRHDFYCTLAVLIGSLTKQP